MFQPSYLTEFQIWLGSGYLRLRMPKNKKVWHKLTRRHRKILGKWTMGASSWNNSSSLNQGEDKEVSSELNDNSPRLPKDGFPPLSEQGDNICQIKWYKEVCSRKTYTIKHWLKGAPKIWVGLHDQCQNGDSISEGLRMNYHPFTSKQ